MNGHSSSTAFTGHNTEKKLYFGGLDFFFNCNYVNNNSKVFLYEIEKWNADIIKPKTH